MTTPPARPSLWPAVKRLAREYLTPHGRALAVAAACMLVAAAGTAALAYLLEPAIRFMFVEKRQEWVIWLPLVIIAVALTGALAAYAAASILAATGQRVVAALQTRMAQSLVRADLAALEADHSAAQAARFTYDATLVRDMVTRGFTGVAKDIPTIILLIGVMFWQDWILSLFVVAVLPLGGLAMRLIATKSHDAAESGMRDTGSLSAAVGETITGRRVIKAYGLEARADQRTEDSIARRLASLIRGERASAATVPVSEALGGVGVAAALAYAGWRGIDGTLSFGAFSSFLAATLMAFQPIRTLSSLTSVFAQGGAALTRIFAVIDAKPAITDAPGAKPLTLGTEPLIAFDKVSFAYAPGTAALSDISFAVRNGERIALVGPSGAGKSTVINLLLRFYDPTAGAVRVAGADIRGVEIASLRRQMALVTQEPFLFDDTIAANIGCGREGATQAEIEAAAVAAEAHGFIAALPDGYQARAGEAGTRLSGGQRQRIAIARAVLRDAPILLLDEATSALDAENEARVQAALDHLMQGRTTLVVAHRLSTIMSADRILVLEDGRIVEDGPHAVLLAQDGLYARLFRTQFAAAP